MSKKVLSVVVVLVVLFALCACNDNSDLLTKIEELESTVQSQSDKISELEGKNSEQLDKISELEEQNRQKSDKIEDLTVEQNIESIIQASVHFGEFSDLETAYEKGWLTRDDIMHISYFSIGNRVIEGTLDGSEPWHTVDFVPTKLISQLSSTAIDVIKEAYEYYLHNKHGEPREGFLTYGNYYGTYNNCVVVTMDYVDTIGDYLGRLEYAEVDGIILYYPSLNFMVWKLK